MNFTKITIRLFDIILSIIGIIFLFPIILISLILSWVDTRSPIFIQIRVGLNQKNFNCYKIRTMYINTPEIETSKIEEKYVCNFGKFLRNYKLDELPQLINVLIGQMSIVGPRPCLPNQYKLIAERIKKNIFIIKPGITGLSQIRGIDMSTPELLAKIDEECVRSLNIVNYFKYIFLTLFNFKQSKLD